MKPQIHGLFTLTTLVVMASCINTASERKSAKTDSQSGAIIAPSFKLRLDTEENPVFNLEGKILELSPQGIPFPKLKEKHPKKIEPSHIEPSHYEKNEAVIVKL